MLEIGGIYYMFDLAAMDKLLTQDHTLDSKLVEEKEYKKIYDEHDKLIGSEEIVKEYFKGKEIDGPKYDAIRMFFEVILTYNEELDDDLGIDRALSKTNLPFKLAFNTLIEYGIIKEIE
jgi:hypothetical protein